MATEIELEKTYLAKAITPQIVDAPSQIIIDRYMPADAVHPIIRLRANGSKYELTKKQPVDGKDSTKQHEHTIPLTKTEYRLFSRLPAKYFVKRRYTCKLGGYDAQVDVYEGELEGLVVIDFEFANEAGMAAFRPPDICLADVSQEAFIAGGVLAGKSYQDIEPFLKKYNYQPITAPGAAA